MSLLVSEQYDFTMTTHEGIEVGVITTHDEFGPTGVTLYHEVDGELIEVDANELFNDDDQAKYNALYNELELTQRI